MLGKQVAELAPKGHFHLMRGLGHCSLYLHRPDEVSRKLLETIEANS